MQSKEAAKHQMYAMIEQWQQSGLSQKAWCLQSGVSYHIFHYWYKRYRDKNNTATGSSFAELKVQPPVESCVELLLPDGKRLLFHQPVSSDFLKAIIS
jgi:transposase-like protein